MRDLVNKCIKELIDKTLPTKTIVSRVRRKDHTRLSMLPLQISTKINCAMESKLLHCNLRFVVQAKCKIRNFFMFKDRIPSL